MSENDNTIRESLLALLKDTNSDSLVKQAIKELIPSKRRGVFLTISFMFIYASTYYGDFTPIIYRIKEIISLTNSISLTLLAMVFTGYAIFQALVSGKTLETLLLKKDNKVSLFKKYNISFLAITITHLTIIIFNTLLYVFLQNINENWQLSILNSKDNYILACFLLACYMIFVLNALIEIKSFLYNIYQCFTLHAYTRYLNGFK